MLSGVHFCAIQISSIKDGVKMMNINCLCRIKNVGSYFRLLVCIVSLSLFSNLHSQCLITPAFPGCTPASSVALTDGATINSGTTMTVNGTFSYSNFTLNGGVLIVCGNLTISAMTVNSGTIFVNSGATLNCNGGGAVVFGSGTNYYNNGTSAFSGHVILNSNVNIINNGNFSSPFNYIVIQGLNATIVNNNILTSGGFMAWIPSSPGCLCLGPSSMTTTNFFYNRTTNSVRVPTPYACLNVRQFASNDNLVTADTGLIVCVPSTISYSGIPNWGSAYVGINCTGCIAALPIELVSFDGYIYNENAYLNWSTMSETNNCLFDVERSTDAYTFTTIGSVSGAIHSTSLLNYQLIDNHIDPNEIYYYKLKQTDCDGNFWYSQMISLSFSNQSIVPEFIINNITYSDLPVINSELVESIRIYNPLGQVLKTLGATDKIELSSFINGIYLIRIASKYGDIKTYKVLKL